MPIFRSLPDLNVVRSLFEDGAIPSSTTYHDIRRMKLESCRIIATRGCTLAFQSPLWSLGMPTEAMRFNFSATRWKVLLLSFEVVDISGGHGANLHRIAFNLWSVLLPCLSLTGRYSFGRLVVVCNVLSRSLRKCSNCNPMADIRSYSWGSGISGCRHFEGRDISSPAVDVMPKYLQPSSHSVLPHAQDMGKITERYIPARSYSQLPPLMASTIPDKQRTSLSCPCHHHHAESVQPQHKVLYTGLGYQQHCAYVQSFLRLPAAQPDA